MKKRHRPLIIIAIVIIATSGTGIIIDAPVASQSSFDWEFMGTSPRAELQIRAAVIALAGTPHGQPSSKLTSKMYYVAELFVGSNWTE